MPSSRPATTVLDQIIGIVALFGFVAMVIGFIVSAGGGWLPPGRVEFPLLDVQGVDVDAQGNVALTNGFYGRIQLYDSRGRFVRGWAADARGGGFTATFLDSGHVASFANRRHSTVVYTLAGNRVREEEVEPVSPEERYGRLAVRAPDGSGLRVTGAQFWPTVVRERRGVTSRAVAQPWYMRLFGPLALMLLPAAALYQFGTTRLRARRGRT